MYVSIYGSSNERCIVLPSTRVGVFVFDAATKLDVCDEEKKAH